jgi:diguanylate cyclase (GGDEF)-like protein
MSKQIEVKTVIFDKNLNRVLETDPIFEALFENIYTLTDLNAFLAQNGMIDQKFIHKLNISGIEHHLCYHTVDNVDSFEFHFFLLSDSWLIINPTGCSDITDRLTGLLNEQNIISLLKHEIKRVQRDKDAATTIIMDIDHLKNINEMFGFIAGDYVLQNIAKILKENTRGSDAVGRYHGDKFIISLHKTDAHGTMQYIKNSPKLLMTLTSLLMILTLMLKSPLVLPYVKNMTLRLNFLKEQRKLLKKQKKGTLLMLSSFFRAPLESL